MALYEVGTYQQLSTVVSPPREREGSWFDSVKQNYNI